MPRKPLGDRPLTGAERQARLRERRPTKLRERAELGEKIARAIAPDAWAEYDEGNGVCTNDAGFRAVSSLDAAARVLDTLTAEGFPIAPKRQRTDEVP